MSDMAIAELQPRKITVDEYHRMAEAGILRRGERVELIDGIIVEMTPIGPSHWATHTRIVAYLNSVLSGIAVVAGQFSMPLDDRNEPQPDIGIFAPRLASFFKRHATVEETFAFIEIADSSLSSDLGPKCRLYAHVGIREYLVVDVVKPRLIRFTKPLEGQYTETQQLSYGETFTLEAVPHVTLEVTTFLPPR